MIKKHLTQLLLLSNAMIIGMAMSLFVVPIISCYINHYAHYFFENFLWMVIGAIFVVLMSKLKINQFKLLIFIILSSLITWLILCFSKKETILSVVQTLWADCQFFYDTNENAELALFVVSGIFLVTVLLQSAIDFIYKKSKP